MRLFTTAFLLAVLVSGCFKQREQKFRIYAEDCPDVEADLYFMPSTNSVRLTSAITSETIEYSWQVSAKESDIELDDRYLRNVRIAVDGVNYVDVTAAVEGRYAWELTQSGTYRAAISAETCSGFLLTKQALVLGRRTFAPIFTVQFDPDIAFSIQTGTEVDAHFSVADRDGSTVYQLWWDFMNGDKNGKREVLPNWDTTRESEFVKSFVYSGSGIYWFRAGVTDEQGDYRQVSFPVLVGSPMTLKSSLPVAFDGRSISALSVTAPEESEWAAIGGTFGMRTFKVQTTDTIVYRGQLPNSVNMSGTSDFDWDPDTQIGYLAVSGEGVYLIDMREPTRPEFYNLNPLRPTSSSDSFVQIEIARLLDHGKYLFVHNGFNKRSFVIRIDKTELKSKLALNQSLATAFCEITNGSIAPPCESSAPNQAPFLSTAVKDVAWVPPFLVTTGLPDRIQIYDAANLITDTAQPGGYSYSEIPGPLLPYIVTADNENRSTGVTGVVVDSGSGLYEFYVGHGTHGMALYQMWLTGASYDLPGGQRSNFTAYLEEGLLNNQSHDSFDQLRMHKGRVVINTRSGGGGRSGILLFNRTEWFARPLTSYYFYYPYVHKCRDYDIAGLSYDGNRMYDPLTYLEDCLVTGNADAMSIAGDELGLSFGSGFSVISLGTPPSAVGDASSRAVIDLSGGVIDYDISEGILAFTRGRETVEFWDYRDVLSGVDGTPKLLAGWSRPGKVDALRFSSGTTEGIWMKSGKTLRWHTVGGDGLISPDPVTSHLFSFYPDKLIFDGKDGYSIKNGTGEVVRFDLTDPGLFISADSVREDYNQISKAGDTLVGLRYLTDGLYVDWLDPVSLLSKAELVLPREDEVVAGAAMEDQNQFAAVIVEGESFDEIVTLRIFRRVGSTVEEVGNIVLPVSGLYSLDSLSVVSRGSHVAVLLSGRNRGLFVFKIEASGAPLYVGANMTQAARSLAGMKMFNDNTGLGLIGHYSEFSKGNINLFYIEP